MATKHFGRDAFYSDDGQGVCGGNQAFANLLLYHMMRTAGFDWLWECDGEVGPHSATPNHCSDGNMESAYDQSWTPVGTGLRTKVTSPVHSGARSLKIVSQVQNDGVRSTALISITNPSTFTGAAADAISGPFDGVMRAYDDGAGIGVKDYTNCRAVCAGFTDPANNGTFLVRDPYCAVLTKYLDLENPAGVAQINLTGSTIQFERRYTVAIWALNPDGDTWDVEVDPGDGAYTSLGQIPVDANGWVLYTFSFYAVSTGARYIRIVDKTVAAAHEIWIDGIMVFRSMFEYAPTNIYDAEPGGNPTGVITGANTFAVGSGGGHFCGDYDIGKWLFLWDTTPGSQNNSGFYKIIGALGGGVIELDLRSGSAALIPTTTTMARWRIVDIEGQAHNDAMGNFQYTAGYGLRSPHASGWRLFARMHFDSYTKPATIWAAPDDVATFNWSTGNFYADGPSTQRNIARPYATYGVYAGTQNWSGVYIGGSGAHFWTRNFFMTDADLSFVAFLHYYEVSASHSMFFVGYTGTDVAHPGIEEFVSMVNWDAVSNMDLGFAGTGYFTYSGIGFDPNGLAVPCSCGYFGWNTAAAFPFNTSNAQENAWSGQEWLLPFCIVRDPDGSYGCYSERDADIGLFLMRTTFPALTTFDAEAYLHIYGGIVMEWNGESLVGVPGDAQ